MVDTLWYLLGHQLSITVTAMQGRSGEGSSKIQRGRILVLRRRFLPRCKAVAGSELSQAILRIRPDSLHASDLESAQEPKRAARRYAVLSLRSERPQKRKRQRG